MKGTFRLSMTWLHTWSGLLLGWVLFAIFVTGTATYYKWEITRWMQPELHRAGTPIDAAHTAMRKLDTVAARSPQWFVDLPDDRRPATSLLWRNPDGPRRFSRETIDPVSGEKVTARDTRGGDFFYRFHFQLQLPHPWGRYLAGVAAMFMFIALISGVVTHRRFFVEFFTFRPGRVSLRSWLDFHNVTAVLALPFYVMITYSALVIFMSMYMPWGRQVLAAPSAPTENRRARGEGPVRGADEKPWIATADLAPMLQAAAQAWGDTGRSLKRIEVADRGTAKCTVTLTRADGPKISHTASEQLRFNGVTGAPLDTVTKAGGPGTAVHDTLYGLHLARFAGPTLRALFFVMGLFGCALIATGLVMWTLKRRAKALAAGRLGFGHGLVERLNLATIAGLPVAIAVFFWANRLLPVGLTDRGDWEVYGFLYAWGVMLLHPLVRPIMQAWHEQLWLGGVLYLLLPALDALTAGPHLQAAWLQRNWAHLGFNAAMLVLGLFLIAAARRVGRRLTPAPQPESAPAFPVAERRAKA